MVVFFDIDGTIVDDKTQVIPESAVRAIRQLRQNGHIPVVNTGRPYTHIDPHILAMDFAGWVCACGMEIYLDGQWLVRRAPDTELCRHTRDVVRKTNMQVLYEADHCTILADGPLSTHPAAVWELELFHKKGYAVREVDSLPEPAFIKFVTFPDENCDRETFLKEMEPWYECIDRITLLELVLKGCSKAGGMEELLTHLGISREETLAIGDSTNDLPMFRVAAHTVCMGNGMDELKKEAEYITSSVLEDGIEKALKHFNLI